MRVHDGARGGRRGRAPAPRAHPPGSRRAGPAAAVTSDARRFRSARRIPAALTALAVLGAAGVLLYDLAAVRAHRPGMRWRRELALQLERYTPVDPEVLIGAGVLALIGAVLLVLAVTPGLRGILQMRTSESGMRAGLGRKAAGLVLRDRAMEVPGVNTVRVKVGRSRIGVRATSHFRELDEVRADLDAVLAVGIEELGLVHKPGPRVRVNRKG
ncbi:DUF6286 domain-containing protein [Streptomyces sp. LN699]|uniref:DUF6286 domain-containing protein n=1 Tax=Streptomyces sp. LN699 TaxID=3112981 RepID=UPI00370FF760